MPVSNLATYRRMHSGQNTDTNYYRPWIANSGVQPPLIRSYFDAVHRPVRPGSRLFLGGQFVHEGPRYYCTNVRDLEAKNIHLGKCHLSEGTRIATFGDKCCCRQNLSWNHICLRQRRQAANAWRNNENYVRLRFTVASAHCKDRPVFCVHTRFVRKRDSLLFSFLRTSINEHHAVATPTVYMTSQNRARSTSHIPQGRGWSISTSKEISRKHRANLMVMTKPGEKSLHNLWTRSTVIDNINMKCSARYWRIRKQTFRS